MPFFENNLVIKIEKIFWGVYFAIYGILQYIYSIIILKNKNNKN